MILVEIKDGTKRIKVKAHSMKGFIYEIVETLNTLRRFKDLPFDIIWGDDCTLCIYRDDELVFWTGTTPENWEVSHLIDNLNKIGKDFRVTLLRNDKE